MDIQKNSDFTKILDESHENKWVALSGNRDEVLGVSADLVELKSKISVKDAVFMKVQPHDVSFAF